MGTLLIVDDESSICWGLSQLGEKLGHEVLTASSAEQGLELAEQHRPDLLILDVRLPGMDGLSALTEFQKFLNGAPVIVITAYGDLETAVDAVRGGAFEYLVKPFELDAMQRAITRALETREGGDAAEAPPQPVGDLVGRSPAIQEVFKQIALAATSQASIMIGGESGTGKELAARAIHQYSDRANGPFVAVNVASLSPSLAESELFGHVRGAFTGADQDRIGLLVQADGGTLFLDEVADIPLPAQVKLLRALEHGEVVPVGGRQSVSTDFRVVSATHQDLETLVQSQQFRHDLFFRLGAFRIEIPPLRHRPEDIEELAEHFLGLAQPADSEHRSTFSSAAMQELKSRPWHGNVRELRHTVEHALILARGGRIEPEHFPDPAAEWTSGEDATDAVASIEQSVRQWTLEQLRSGDGEQPLHDQLIQIVEGPLFEAALEFHGGQYSAAARRLGIHRTTLKRKTE